MITWGPAPIEPTHHLDLSWYGIHPVELLFSHPGQYDNDWSQPPAAQLVEDTSCVSPSTAV